MLPRHTKWGAIKPRVTGNDGATASSPVRGREQTDIEATGSSEGMNGSIPTDEYLHD